MNFVHRANVERILQQHGMMSVERVQMNDGRSSTTTTNKKNKKVTLDRVLRRVIDVHWLRACPDKPLCELCMGRVAVTTCLSCDQKSVSEEYFHTKDRAVAKTKKMKADGKESGGSGGSGGRGGGSSGGASTTTTKLTASGLSVSMDPKSSELLESYERNLSERTVVNLCFQCDRHLHRMSTKLGKCVNIFCFLTTTFHYKNIYRTVKFLHIFNFFSLDTLFLFSFRNSSISR